VSGECDGLGVKQFFDPERVVAHPHLSLARGAVRGWDRENFHYFQLIKGAGAAFSFRGGYAVPGVAGAHPHLDFARQRRRSARFRLSEQRGETTHRRHAFEGMIPNMERRYRETESNLVRDELAKYLSSQPCPTCQGARLTRSARHVFVAGRSVPEIVGLPIGAARDFFGQLSLPGRRGEIAVKIVKEIGERLNFLVNVGLDYLTWSAAPTLCPAARPSASGWPRRSARGWSG
jgi:excinuclease ABC subunit A